MVIHALTSFAEMRAIYPTTLSVLATLRTNDPLIAMLGELIDASHSLQYAVTALAIRTYTHDVCHRIAEVVDIERSMFRGRIFALVDTDGDSYDVLLDCRERPVWILLESTISASDFANSYRHISEGVEFFESADVSWIDLSQDRQRQNAEQCEILRDLATRLINQLSHLTIIKHVYNLEQTCSPTSYTITHVQTLAHQ